jgi:hypothetical protein
VLSNYRGFIDQMVALADRNVSAGLIRKNGHGERQNERDLPLDASEQERKELLLGLSPAQRSVIAQMLVDERRAAVHDVMAHLEWAVSCSYLEMFGDGEAFAGQPDETMHGDFITRLEGEPWR